MMKSRILVVDDEPSATEMVSSFLYSEDMEIMRAHSGQEAFDLCCKQVFDIILCDLKMPGIDGFQLLQMLKSEGFTPSVIIMTAFPSVESAVKAMQMGATNYILKPVNRNLLTHMVRKEIKMRALRHEVSLLKFQVRDKYKIDKIVSKSVKMYQVFEKITRVAETNSTVLIQGETGTGKELVASAIHAQSSRSNNPFISVNVSALAPALLESELFGHMKGAFTGALYEKKGKFEMAHGGTIFLDEIGEIAPDVQVKLLRILQERRCERVGGTKTIKLDIRFIAATNKNLTEEMENGRFRNDLYYRLNIFPIDIPPLRDRKEDIPLLIAHFLKILEPVTHKTFKHISPSALDKMMQYSWPGNVRELENIIERAMITEKGDTLSNINIPESTYIAPNMDQGFADKKDISIPPLTEYINNRESEYLTALLAQNRGSIEKTASMAGINSNTLYKKMKKLSLNKETFKCRIQNEF